MRMIILAAASAIALAACNKAPATTDATASPEAAQPGHDDHDVAAMDETMKASDAADDAQAVLTPDGHTFHTYPKKIETIRIPKDGGFWSGHGYAETDLFKMLDSKDDKLADGTPISAVRFEMLASGNGKVVFEKRATENPNDPVLEARSFNFMIH